MSTEKMTIAGVLLAFVTVVIFTSNDRAKTIEHQNSLFKEAIKQNMDPVRVGCGISIIEKRKDFIADECKELMKCLYLTDLVSKMQSQNKVTELETAR